MSSVYSRMDEDNSARFPNLDFAYNLPYISERNFEILKVVARHSVYNPESVAKRSAEFGFSQKTHEYYPSYQSFVKQYSLIKDGAQLSTGNVIKRAIQRAHKSALSEPLAARSKTGMMTRRDQGIDMSIDWQDFVVLETLEFFSVDSNGTSKLSAPFSIEEMRLVKDTDPATEPSFRSAITGELVPESQYNDHVKMMQIDPTYYKQKEIEQQRAISNIDYDNVSKNLQRLRQKRTKTSND